MNEPPEHFTIKVFWSTSAQKKEQEEGFRGRIVGRLGRGMLKGLLVPKVRSRKLISGEES